MSKTALLVIDVQQSFLHRDYWDEAELPAYQEAQLRLIDGFVRAGHPVINIFHEDGDGVFSAASGLVKAMDWIGHTPDAIFIKHVHNAFTDTGLKAWLDEHGIRRVAVSGIRTEQCCETTTRVASDLGFEVDFVSEATLTFAMTHPHSGQRYSPTDIRARTELVLAGRFARIATVDQALAALSPQ